MKDKRYPLNKLVEVALLRSKPLVSPQSNPQIREIVKHLPSQGGFGSAGGVFSCSSLEDCQTALCSLTGNCGYCTTETCNRLKDILRKLVDCVDCPEITDEDREWLNNSETSEYEWLIWDETQTGYLQKGWYDRTIIVNRGSALDCPASDQSNCENNFGCSDYGTEILRELEGTGYQFEKQGTDTISRDPQLTGLIGADIRKSYLNFYTGHSIDSYGYFVYYAPSGQTTDYLLIYPTEILGQRNLTGFRISFTELTLDQCAIKVQVATASLHFADVLWEQTITADGDYEFRVHDDDLSGAINEAAGENDFMIIRLVIYPTSETANVSGAEFKVWAITTAPPPTHYANYEDFIKNVCEWADEGQTVNWQVSKDFFGNPITTVCTTYGLDSYSVNFVGGDVNLADCWIERSYVDVEGCGDIPSCGCCCANVRSDECEYCIQFEEYYRDRYATAYTSIISQTTLTDDGDSYSATISVQAVAQKLPRKVYEQDWAILDQLGD